MRMATRPGPPEPLRVAGFHLRKDAIHEAGSEVLSALRDESGVESVETQHLVDRP